jgi:predicted ABC-type transport system involved in lysophospholipase L1 biosynthesis ATPase subunit
MNLWRFDLGLFPTPAGHWGCACGGCAFTVLLVAELLGVEGVWKGYSRGGHWAGVLSGVSFEVGCGEVVAVVGSRLGGKSTLLRVAAGMERADQGSVWLGDQLLGGMGDRLRARLLGHEIVWVDRDGPELGLEVSKFVGWPLALHGRGRRGADQLAARALERVGAQACAGRRWGELSNWQRVLVGLARAFAGAPRLVVIDDLLDALGGKGTEEASDLLRSLVEESEHRCGVLMSATDVESAMFADRMLSLTRTGTLKAMSGESRGEANVIQFPGGPESQDWRGVGCS